MRSALVAINIHATPEDAFDLVHDYSWRLDWDPFLREAVLLHGAQFANIGVSSRCVARRAVWQWRLSTSPFHALQLPPSR
jgi:hypothetical protein